MLTPSEREMLSRQIEELADDIDRAFDELRQRLSALANEIERQKPSAPVRTTERRAKQRPYPSSRAGPRSDD
jgi:hypothetical protein